MRVFCDTSVLVAGCVKAHPHHSRAQPLLQEIAEGTIQGYCAAHSIAEAFSALTTIPVQPRITPAEAIALVAHNLQKPFKLISAKTIHYEKALAACLTAGVSGGIVYDALLIECARASDAERIYTFNKSHFVLLAPDLADRIVAP